MVTASYGRYGQRAARIGPDRICRIPLPVSVSVPFFQRRHGPCCAKPTRILSGWPGQGLAKQIWSGSKPVCRNHLTVSHFQTQFRSFATDVSDNAVPNQPGSIQFWLIVSGFGQTDPVRKQAGVQESSGPLLANASQPIRTGSESDPACLLGNFPQGTMKY